MLSPAAAPVAWLHDASHRHAADAASQLELPLPSAADYHSER